MGSTHYFVLRQGDGRIFVTSLHFTTKKRPCLHYHNFQQDIAHQRRTESSWGTLGDVPEQLEAVPTSAGKHVNRALNDLEIERHSNPPNYCVLFAPSTSEDQRLSSIFQSPNIVLESHHFLCNYKLTLHHVAFENFPHEVNWVGAFWSKV